MTPSRKFEQRFAAARPRQPVSAQLAARRTQPRFPCQSLLQLASLVRDAIEIRHHPDPQTPSQRERHQDQGSQRLRQAQFQIGPDQANSLVRLEAAQSCWMLHLFRVRRAGNRLIHLSLQCLVSRCLAIQTRNGTQAPSQLSLQQLAPIPLATALLPLVQTIPIRFHEPQNPFALPFPPSQQFFLRARHQRE